MGKQFWWNANADKLIDLVSTQPTPLYVYSAPEIRQRVEETQKKLGSSVDRLWYAVKANHNENVLRAIYQDGLLSGGFECVSIEEVKHVMKVIPQLPKSKILLTPNFASRQEIAEAFELCGYVTLDNTWPFYNWPRDIFHQRQVILRLDRGPDDADNHHYIKTSGEQSKFGISFEKDEIPNLSDFREHLKEIGCKVVGLHIHMGSQLFDPETWSRNAQYMGEFLNAFPDVKFINVGGGLGVQYEYDAAPKNVDLDSVNEILSKVKRQLAEKRPGIEIWMESGRYLVAEAGVLLARITQLKSKAGRHFIGCDAGMNSLIRPALYGAYHHIVNLSSNSRTNNNVSPTKLYDIVGQICESADFLAKNRSMPSDNREGDVLLVETAGAYGHVMSSHYNMRSIPHEFCFDN